MIGIDGVDRPARVKRIEVEECLCVSKLLEGEDVAVAGSCQSGLGRLLEVNLKSKAWQLCPSITV